MNLGWLMVYRWKVRATVQLVQIVKVCSLPRSRTELHRYEPSQAYNSNAINYNCCILGKHAFAWLMFMFAFFALGGVTTQ